MCKNCSLKPEIEKYFGENIKIHNCNIVKINSISNISSFGKYFKGEDFLNVVVKNYCKKYKDKNL
jgi:hypothetical protein